MQAEIKILYINMERKKKSTKLCYFTTRHMAEHQPVLELCLGGID